MATSDNSKDSTAASGNKERLAQDGEYTVMNQSFEKQLKNNEDAEETSQLRTDAAAPEAETLGRNGLEGQDDLGIVMGTEADVTEDDIVLLGDPEQDMDGGDDEMYAKAGLDDTDLEGDPLNEAEMNMASTGDDLDIPGDTPNNPRSDAMGQGDEENDYYSMGSDDNDNMNEGTP
jgi:hypothetical protein